MLFWNTLVLRTIRQYSSTVTKNVEAQIPHKPVMLDEVLKYLNIQKGETCMDMTFGAGGHTRKILNSVSGVKIIAVDRDPVAYQYAENLSNEYPSQIIPLLGRFSELPALLEAKDIAPNSVDCILLDLGCSSMQFDNGSRGFSISHMGPLDMRMDGNRLPDAPTAADVLARATEEDLYKIIKIYGEEKQARKISRAIIEARYMFKPLTTTEELADLVQSVCTEEFRLDKLQRRSHVATKTFQALRIFVNNELNEINYAFVLAHYYLKIGGRIVSISFHSLEDTIAKRHLTGNLLGSTANPLPLKYNNYATTVDHNLVEKIMKPKWKMLHQHVLLPKYEEVEDNPRSRSAKLRAAVKIV